jgi:hypothetical protein
MRLGTGYVRRRGPNHVAKRFRASPGATPRPRDELRPRSLATKPTIATIAPEDDALAVLSVASLPVRRGLPRWPPVRTPSRPSSALREASQLGVDLCVLFGAERSGAR